MLHIRQNILIKIVRPDIMKQSSTKEEPTRRMTELVYVGRWTRREGLANERSWLSESPQELCV